MVGDWVHCTSQIERLNIGITTVIDESSFITIKHTIQTKREKFIVVRLLYHFFSLFCFWGIIHIKEVRKAIWVIICASHVTLLLCNNFSHIFHQKGTCRDVFHGYKTPHFDQWWSLWHYWARNRAIFTQLWWSTVHWSLWVLFGDYFCGVDRTYMLLKSLDEELPFPFILMSHEVILAEVFIASTFWVALIEAKDLIDWSLSTKLICNHLTRSRWHCFTVGGVLKLAVPFIARTLSRVLTAIKTVAETGSSRFLQVLSYVVIDDNVRRDVLRIEKYIQRIVIKQ